MFFWILTVIMHFHNRDTFKTLMESLIIMHTQVGKKISA